MKHKSRRRAHEALDAEFTAREVPGLRREKSLRIAARIQTMRKTFLQNFCFGEANGKQANCHKFFVEVLSEAFTARSVNSVFSYILSLIFTGDGTERAVS